MAMESPAAFNQASSYTAEQSRRAWFGGMLARASANIPGIVTGGLFSSTDLQISAPTSGMSVNVSTGECYVGGTEGGAQGAYYARNSSITNTTIAAASASNPRIDTVCVTVSDSGYTEPAGGSGNGVSLLVVTGTPTAGATLSNLSGASSVPESSLVLGYVLVPANATSIITANIKNVAPVASSQFSSVSACETELTFTFPEVASGWTTFANALSLNCSGGPLLVMAGPITIQFTAAPSTNLQIGFSLDGATPTNVTEVPIDPTGGEYVPQTVTPMAILTPSPGVHTITPQASCPAGTYGVPAYTGQLVAIGL